jgi:hypothetical protein
MYAQQLLEEYFDPDSVADRRERYIPIRSRSEFLPAVAVWRDERNEDDRGFAQGVQFELPLNADAPARHAAEVKSPKAPVNVQPVAESPIRFPAPADFCDAGVKVPATQATPVEVRHVNEKPPMDWARPRVSFQPVSRRNPRGSFDPKRFLYGCLLGSAAAAVVLLMVSAVFG